jgi:hypothetical protein
LRGLAGYAASVQFGYPGLFELIDLSVNIHPSGVDIE